ncbi:calcium-independent phospholipase A2 VIA [Arctopsyche grandis]|uniref:calcium-independent phospholipase A2 VIA n=1 Tax=Arctopsyche grandis TaxID=121162 RepID=UPI00406D87F9
MFRSDPGNTTVIAIQTKKYQQKRVICRENGVMLYGPMPGIPTNDIPYHVVLLQPVSKSTDSAYSLFRCNELNQTKAIFEAVKETVPYFVSVTKKYDIKLIQEICDLMRKNPMWSLAHLIVKMNKMTLLEDPAVQCHINDQDFEGGMTPIMLAITNKNLPMVKALVSLDCSLNILCAGSSVLHYAASNDKNILKYLLTINDGKIWLNSRNNIGLTPLHCACQSEEDECLQILLDAGAVLSAPGNMVKENLTSPLHVCKSSAVLESLILNGCDVNDINEFGETPLHLMVRNSNYDCTIALLSNGANPSADDINGNTPLHDAVKVGDIRIVKALIVFGAEINFMDKKGYTPRHYIDIRKENSAKLLHILHAVGAKRCQPDLHGCEDFCSSSGTNNGAMTPTDGAHPAKNPLEHMLTVAGMERAAIEKRKITGGRLLCLDGGGVRGLILIQMLSEFEILAGRSIIDCFDWVAGTSAGGILALALSTGRSLSECRRLFFKFKNEAFKGDRPYTSDSIEKLFKEYFTEDTLFSSIKHPKLLITSVKTDRYPLCLHIFRNYTSPVDILNFGGESSSHIPKKHIWELARCTSAAPTYFNSYKSFLDGGLIANNPTLDALTDMLEYSLALRAIGQSDTTDFATIVLSCGTGLVPYTKIENSLFDTNWSSSGILGKALIVASRIKHLGNLIVELIAGSDGRLVDRARSWCSTAGVPYYRFNPPISANVPLDETSNDIIVDILWETKAYMYKNSVLSREVVDCLLRDSN